MEDNIADKLKAMLDDPNTLSTLSALMSSMQSRGAEPADDNSGESVPVQASVSQAEAMAKIQQAMGQLSSNNDPRINLLNSLKPYMRQTRLTKMDQAIRLIQISKMANLFKG